MPKRELSLYIDDIYLSCNKILTYTSGYNFTKFKNIPWKEITGMRDKVTHEYFGIDEGILWATVEEDVPALMKEIFKIKNSFKNQKLF